MLTITNDLTQFSEKLKLLDEGINLRCYILIDKYKKFY